LKEEPSWISSGGLGTSRPGSHGRLLGVLARTDEPLTPRQVALRARMSPRGAVGALEDLVAAGVVWRAKLRSDCYWHVLYREHVAARAIFALARLPLTLGRRIAADW
jgi:hypothetical protein